MELDEEYVDQHTRPCPCGGVAASRGFHGEVENFECTKCGLKFTNVRDLVKKLSPHRFTEMSPKMGAIVGYILSEKFTDPELIAVAITSDGIVMGQRENDIGLNDILGSVQDLECNWRNLLDAAELTAEERKLAAFLYKNGITDWRQGTGRRPSAPALQNIPLRTATGKELRDALSETILAPVDYAAIEQRIRDNAKGKKR